MVIQKEALRQQDEAEREAKTQQKIGNSAAGGPSPGGQKMQGETVEFVNENA